MKFTLTVDVENDAFQPEPKHELVAILNKVIQRVEEDGFASHAKRGAAAEMVIRDRNGNTVGLARLTP